jgi:hypothetical protein
MTNVPGDADNRRRMQHAAREMVADIHKLIPLPEPYRPCSEFSLSIKDRVLRKYCVSEIHNFHVWVLCRIETPYQNAPSGYIRTRRSPDMESRCENMEYTIVDS